MLSIAETLISPPSFADMFLDTLSTTLKEPDCGCSAVPPPPPPPPPPPQATRSEHKTAKIKPYRMLRTMAPSATCLNRDSLKQPADTLAQPFLDLLKPLFELQVHLVGRRADSGAVPFPVRRPLGLLLDGGLGPLGEVAPHHLRNRRGGTLRDLQVRDHGVIHVLHEGARHGLRDPADDPPRGHAAIAPPSGGSDPGADHTAEHCSPVSPGHDRLQRGWIDLADGKDVSLEQVMGLVRILDDPVPFPSNRGGEILEDVDFLVRGVLDVDEDGFLVSAHRIQEDQIG